MVEHSAAVVHPELLFHSGTCWPRTQKRHNVVVVDAWAGFESFFFSAGRGAEIPVVRR